MDFGRVFLFGERKLAELRFEARKRRREGVFCETEFFAGGHARRFYGTKPISTGPERCLRRGAQDAKLSWPIRPFLTDGNRVAQDGERAWPKTCRFSIFKELLANASNTFRRGGLTRTGGRAIRIKRKTPENTAVVSWFKDNVRQDVAR